MELRLVLGIAAEAQPRAVDERGARADRGVGGDGVARAVLVRNVRQRRAAHGFRAARNRRGIAPVRLRALGGGGDLADRVHHRLRDLGGGGRAFFVVGIDLQRVRVRSLAER